MDTSNLLFRIVAFILVGLAAAKCADMLGHKNISKGILTLTTVVTFGSIVYLMYGVVYSIIYVFNLNM